MTAKSFSTLVSVGVLLAFLSATAPGATWNVSTFGQITTAKNNAVPGDEIVIAPGSYHVTSALYITTPGVTFRGATGNRDDVVLYGNGMNVNSGVLEGFWAAADDIELRDLTIEGFYHHGIHIAGNPYADNVVISNVKTLNCGERHLKGSSGSGVSDNVLIDNLWMEQTEEYLPRLGHPVDPNNYIGGIDAMHINNWTIRNSTAVNIRGATGGGRAAIFLWNGVTDVVVDSNTIISSGHGISIGNPSGPNGSHTGDYHAIGGKIINNTILRRGETYDWALELDNVKDFVVSNNTIYSQDASYFRTVQIYDESDEGMIDNVQFTNNIIRGGIKDMTTNGGWSNADVVAMGNIVDTSGTVVLPEWFADAAAGDFHLTPLAIDAIDAATVMADVTFDIDGQARGSSPDMGADELNIPGDVDLDGDVDGADLAAIALNWAPAASDRTWSQGDFDSDGDVDGTDLAAVGLNWNPAGPTMVPEPASLGLLLIAAAALIRRRRR